MKLNLFLPLTKVDVKERVVYGVAAVEEPDRSREIFDYESSKPLFQAWSASFEKVTDGKSLGNVRAMHGKVAAGKLDEITFDDVNKTISVAAKIVDDNEWKKVEEGVYTGFSIGGAYAKRWPDGDLHRYTATPSEISIVDNPCMPSATFSMIKMDGTTEDRPFTSVIVEKKMPSNDEVAAKARELAKTAGDESRWFEQIEAATIELIKALNPAPAPAPVADVVDPAKPAEVAKDAVVDQTSTNPEPELSQVWQAKDGKTFAKKADAISHNAELAKAAADADSPAAKLAASLAKLDTTVAAKEAVVEIVKTLRFSELKKDMCDVSRLASIISDLQWLHASVAWEAQAEGDKSKLPAALKQNMTDLISALVAMVKEETNEVLSSADAVMQMSAKPLGFDALVKTFEGEDAVLAKLNALAETVPAPAVDKTVGAEVAKAALAERDATIVSLNKTISDTTVAVDALVKRVETLENSPVPGGPKTTDTYRVVDKSDDDSMKALEAQVEKDPAALVQSLIKLAQKNPQRLS